jgi:hypothetical protein
VGTGADVSAALIEVAAAGALSSLQDLGRVGWRRMGVPRAGALDPAALRIANALAGNDGAHAAIEFFVAGPTLKAIEAPVCVGLAARPCVASRCGRGPAGSTARPRRRLR